MNVYLVIHNSNDDKDKTYTIKGCFDTKVEACKVASQIYCNDILPKLTNEMWTEEQLNQTKQRGWLTNHKLEYKSGKEMGEFAQDIISSANDIEDIVDFYDEDWIDFYHTIDSFAEIAFDVTSCIKGGYCVMNVKVVQFKINSTERPFHYVVE